MLAFVAIIGIVGFTPMRTNKPVMGRVPAPLHALSKPEPASLLAGTDLALTAKQRSDIQAIEASWTTERAKLLEAMSAYEPRQGRSDQISASLQGYSELSRAYDSTRVRYWTVAFAQLDSRQRSLIEGVSK